MSPHTLHHRVITYSALALILRHNKPMPVRDFVNILGSDFGAEFSRNEILSALVSAEGKKYFTRSVEYCTPNSAKTKNIYALYPEFCAALEGRLLSEAGNVNNVVRGISYFVRADKRYRKWFKKSPMQLFGEVAGQYSGRK